MTTLTAAAERLTSSMLDSKRMFKDEDYPRLLRTALAALNAVRPLHQEEAVAEGASASRPGGASGATLRAASHRWFRHGFFLTSALEFSSCPHRRRPTAPAGSVRR